MAQPSRRKVAMIGLDALDFDRVQAALADLPALRRLFERGRVCPLTSPATHLTSAVWPTFATGRPPGHHGIYYPMQWDPATMSLRRVSAEWLPFEPFWYGLERHGVRTTVLDVPFSLPSRLEVGTEVANWGSQECLGPLSSNRPEIVRAIRARFGRHPMGEEIPVAPTRARLERLRRDLLAGVDRKAELARHLMRETDWDLFVTVFAEPHRAGHSLWPLPGELGAAVPDGALAEVERAVDAALGKVLAGIEARSTAIVVFSVHGMGPGFTQEHFVQAAVERVDARFAGEDPEADGRANGRASPVRALRALVPGHVQYLLAKALPSAARDFVVRRSFLGGLDWSRTAGFALPASGDGYVRLNVAGRERNGTLTGAETRRYQELLEEGLVGLRTDAGEAVVRDVPALAAVFPGPRSHLLPDHVVRWQPVLPARAVASPTLGRMVAELRTGRTGDHRPGGFAVVLAPDGRTGRPPPLADVADLAGLARSLLAVT